MSACTARWFIDLPLDLRRRIYSVSRDLSRQDEGKRRIAAALLRRTAYTMRGWWMLQVQFALSATKLLTIQSHDLGWSVFVCEVSRVRLTLTVADDRVIVDMQPLRHNIHHGNIGNKDYEYAIDYWS